MMARRRGFFAELQHQAALAEKERQRKQTAAMRVQAEAQKESERAQAAARRAYEAAARADARSKAAAEREAKRLRVEAMRAIAANGTAMAEAEAEEIDSVLMATLDVDDYVDLAALRQKVSHPPFHSDHKNAITPPKPVEVEAEPAYTEPRPPAGFKAMFGGLKRHEQAVAATREEFARKHADWQERAAAAPALQLEQMQQYQAAEIERQRLLAVDRAQYDLECQERQREVDAHNKRLDDMIAGLSKGESPAVREYIEIVLGNSVYPNGFEVESEVRFDSDSGELTVSLLVPAPDEFPKIKAFKYVQSQDEVKEVPRTAKDQRDRYAGFLHQCVLRTLHEIWEADRDRVIVSISLKAGVEHTSPATGKDVTTPLLALAVSRQHFEDIELAKVDPKESLKHLRAVVSKDLFNLVAIDDQKGVRT